MRAAAWRAEGAPVPAITGTDRGTSRAHRVEQGDPLGGLEGGRLPRRAGHHHGAHPEVDELRRQRGAGRCVELAPVVEQRDQRDADTGEDSRSHDRKLPGGGAPQDAAEVVPGDRKAPTEVEPVGVVAVHARIELERVAAVALGLDEHPVEQTVGVPGAPSRLARDEVLDVEIVTPRQHVPDVETGRAGGGSVTVVERCDQPVAGRPLHVVHARDELGCRPDVRPQLEHRFVRETGISGRELSNAHAVKHY